MALMNKGQVSFYGSPQDMLKQAEGKVWRIKVTSDELQVVADEIEGYEAESYPPNLEHAYVYYMENKLNLWTND